jgi:hypothetical protein
METDKLITEFVNREKELQHNPFLATRIMSSLAVKQRKSIGYFQYVGIAACIATLIVLGISIGNTYDNTPKQYSELNINDSEMENFAIYNAKNNE